MEAGVTDAHVEDLLLTGIHGGSPPCTQATSLQPNPGSSGTKLVGNLGGNRRKLVWRTGKIDNKGIADQRLDDMSGIPQFEIPAAGGARVPGRSSW